MDSNFRHRMANCCENGFWHEWESSKALGKCRGTLPLRESCSTDSNVPTAQNIPSMMRNFAKFVCLINLAN